MKSAAAQSLGSIAVGNQAKYLPYILQMIDSKPTLQYLLLHSIKEVIGAYSIDGSETVSPVKTLMSSADVKKIQGLLFSYCASEEEGDRKSVV